MARKPLTYFPVYPDDALAAIYRTGETTEETGARFRLWCVSCRERWPGTLPDDDDKLAEWAGLDLATWKRIKPVLTASWQRNKTKTRWVIRRIRQQMLSLAERRSQAGRAAAKRWKGESKAHATALPGALLRPHTQSALPNDAIPSQAIPSHTKQEKKANQSLPEGPRYAPSEAEQIAERLGALRQKYPRWWTTLDSMFRHWLRTGPPLEVVCRALDQCIKHDAKDPPAYIAKILRVETPNWHESQAIAAHRELDPKEDRHGRSEPTALADILPPIGREDA